MYPQKGFFNPKAPLCYVDINKTQFSNQKLKYNGNTSETFSSHSKSKSFRMTLKNLKLITEISTFIAFTLNAIVKSATINRKCEQLE